MKKSTLTFKVELDENNLPVNILMNSSDGKDKDVKLKSLLISAWDEQARETIKMDIWVQKMMVEEMFIMYYQTLFSMSDTLSRSTGHHKLSEALKDYCKFFADETKILDLRKQK